MNKPQDFWGVVVSSEISLEGMGGTLFLLGIISVLSGYKILPLTVMISGLFFGGLSAILLLIHSNNPFKASINVYKNLSSPMTIGAIFLTFFMIIGIIYVLYTVGLSEKGSIYSITMMLSLILALAIITYPGFLLAYAKNMPFWRHSIFPVLFLTISFITGFAMFQTILGALYYLGVGEVANLANKSLLVRLNALFTAFGMVMVISHLFIARNSPSSLRSFQIMVKENLFWPAIGLGVIVPVFLTLIFSSLHNPLLIIIASISTIIGWFIIRHLFIKAGTLNSIRLEGLEINP